MKKKILGIMLLLVITISLTGCGNKGTSKMTADEVVQKYCDTLVNGNYGDILDIADIPENEFTTSEYIDGAKSSYSERFRKNNDGTITCTFTKSEEDDDKIYYKLVINDTKTETIELNKENNKIIIDDVYVKAYITAPKGSTVTLDGIDISKYMTEDPLNTGGRIERQYYVLYVLEDNMPHAKSTHPLLKDQEADFNGIGDGNGGTLQAVRFTDNIGYDNSLTGDYTVGQNATQTNIKSDYYDDVKKLIDDVIISLVTDIKKGNDTSKYNEYFVDNDASIVKNISTLNTEDFPFESHVAFLDIRGTDEIGVDSYGPYIILVKSNDSWKIKSVFASDLSVSATD